MHFGSSENVDFYKYSLNPLPLQTLGYGHANVVCRKCEPVIGLGLIKNGRWIKILQKSDGQIVRPG